MKQYLTKTEPCNDCQTPIQVTEPSSNGDTILCMSCMVEREADVQLIEEQRRQSLYNLVGKPPIL